MGRGSQLINQTLINRFLRLSGKDVTEVSHIRPTKGFEVEEVRLFGKTVKLWDLSGEVSYRGIWKNYLTDCDVAFILIDGTETSEEHFESLKTVLAKIDFGLAKRIAVLIMKSDLKGFNSTVIVDFLRREGVYGKLWNLEEVSFRDADLHLKMQILVEQMVKDK